VALIACERGHVALARGESAREHLGKASVVAAAAVVGLESELGRAIAKLEHAVRAAEEGKRLVRGECETDMPSGMERWLAQSDSPRPS
jgi:hypothetical protein